MHPPKLLIAASLALFGALTANVWAESLPQMRPALIGSGPGSLVNLIDSQALFQKGQRDAWVMFECAVLGDGVPRPTDFFTASPESNLLKNEVRRRLRQTRFIPAVYNHKRTWSWFSGTVVFVVGRVRALQAHTLPQDNASTRVLQKCGFTLTGEIMHPEDGAVWRWEMQSSNVGGQRT